MSIKAGYDLYIADNKQDQLLIQKDFQDLFSHAFNKPITDTQWMHYYLNYPLGQTISFAYYYQDIMIAHGGIIPQQLVSNKGKIICYFLQTGVMARKEHQNLSVFKDLMDNISSYIHKQKTFVLAYPNKKTYLPFVMLWGWRLVREYSIKQFGIVDGQYDPKYASSSKSGNEYEYEYELNTNKQFLQWRGELNSLKVIEEEKYRIIYKDYEGSMEILDIHTPFKDHPIPLAKIAIGLSYKRINIPECFFHMVSLKNLHLDGSIGVIQRMCFYPEHVESVRYESIKPSLLLSDVF